MKYHDQLPMRARVVTEISCYVDNQPGMLSKMTQLFSRNNVNIQGIQVYEGQLQSLIMLVVNQPAVAEKILRDLGIELISESDILEVQVPNRVGGLEGVATLLGSKGINIKTVYSSDGHGDLGIAYIKVDQVQEGLKLINSVPLDQRQHRNLKETADITSKISSERR